MINLFPNIWLKVMYIINLVMLMFSRLLFMIHPLLLSDLSRNLIHLPHWWKTVAWTWTQKPRTEGGRKWRWGGHSCKWFSSRPWFPFHLEGFLFWPAISKTINSSSTCFLPLHPIIIILPQVMFIGSVIHTAGLKGKYYKQAGAEQCQAQEKLWLVINWGGLPVKKTLRSSSINQQIEVVFHLC